MGMVPLVLLSGVLLIAAFGMGRVPDADADHLSPHTFGACVLAGGSISLRGGWPSCVTIEVGYDRVYASFECANGQEVPYEIWIEQQTVFVTYLLQPDRTSERSQGGIDSSSTLATPSPDDCPAS